MPGPVVAATAFAAAAFRIYESTHVLEAIRGDKSRGDQLPQRIFGLTGQPRSSPRQICEKERPIARECGKDVPSSV
jgi:hypothetical protein